MADATCPVQSTLVYLSDRIRSGKLTEPRTRRVCEQILQLVEEISNGHAGDDHLDAVRSLINDLFDAPDKHQGIETGAYLKSVLDKDGPVFESHIRTGNCAAMACRRLTPSPCQMACPAGIDVPTYLSLIAEGKDADAIAVIRRDNPLPWVCGLVCTRPCELMCVRGRMDTPISIKFLKAFAAERALSDDQYVNPPRKPDNGRKVCVVGAGPAGLSAAYYLALMGYGVRVIESLPVPGGMLMVGIPRYRLPREVIDRETAKIQSLGVEFCYDTTFGRDMTLDTLKAEGFEAFFLAIGAHKSYQLGLEREEEYKGRGVVDSVHFLKAVALGHREIPGRRVVVIGGGNVAIDAARTCLRLGVKEVTIAYRRTRSEMPADVEEVEHAEEEGVRFSFLTIPTAIEGDGEKVTGLGCVRAELTRRKGSDRLYPKPVEGSDYILEADAVISAIGQFVSQDEIVDFKGVRWTRRGTIEVRHTSMETSEPGVFAAGDAVTGPATVIEAIGGGKRAAEAIDRYFNGIPQPRIPPVPVRYRRETPLEMPAATKMVLKRPHMPMLNMERRRITFQQAELGYTENMVREEARRCLRCDICLRCGKCVQVCRDMGINALEFGYMDFDNPGPTDYRKTAERCIACGACAANCPTDAMTIEDRNGERLLMLCGTIINRQKLIHCEACGEVLGTAGYLEYVKRKTEPVGRVTQSPGLCNRCAREKSAGHSDTAMPVPGQL